MNIFLRAPLTGSVLLLASVVACTSLQVAEPADGPAAGVDPRPLPIARQTTGSELFQAVEVRLLEGLVDLRYHVTSEGAFQADLEGTLRIDPERVTLAGDGTFGGTAVSLRLHADADSMEIRAPEHAATETTPPHLGESLVIGLTRMGILHNLARLTAGRAPDRADGGVREWVEVREVRRDPSGGREDEVGIRFDIHVGGSRTAEAVLWLDATTGLPLRREQVVRFATGEMRVVERYRFEF